jgi:hypothetical protein
MRIGGCTRRTILWCTLVIAACVLVMLIANELFLQPGQGGLFNRGNQSVPTHSGVDPSAYKLPTGHPRQFARRAFGQPPIRHHLPTRLLRFSFAPREARPGQVTTSFWDSARSLAQPQKIPSARGERDSVRRPVSSYVVVRLQGVVALH